jgi:hypothetical protein
MRALTVTVAVALASLVAATPAWAQEADDVEDDGEAGEALERPRREGDSKRVAVLVLATSGVDSETADALTELAIGVIALRGGTTIVGKEEFQALLGQGEARSIECVSSTACLGRIGVELDVDELVAGTVGRRDTQWIFNVNRIDIRTGELAGRVFREVDGDVGALADAMQAAVPELYERARQPGALIVSANVEGAEVVVDGALVGIYRGSPVELRGVTPGRHEVTVSASGYFDWSRVVNVADGATMQIDAALEAPRRDGEDDGSGGSRISPLLWVGLGAAAAAGGLAIAFGIASQAERPAPDTVTRAEAAEFVDARRLEANIANVAMGIAGAGLVAALVGLLVSDFGGDDETVSASVAPLPGGAAAIVGGRL